MMKTIVIGLGGNALLSPSGRQSINSELSNAAVVARQIAKFAAARKHRIIITHGNGPQIGDELARNASAKGSVPGLPFYILSSETEAQIGTVLELALRNELAHVGSKTEVSTVLTHVVVDARDPAFRDPSKPIGPLVDRPDRDGSYRKFGNKYRLVVPSPIPKHILELESIKMLSDAGIVIACGGGGIPVVKNRKAYSGVAGVIDKDRTTQLLATSMHADEMVLLTNVDRVYSDYEHRKGGIVEVRASMLKKKLSMFEAGTIRPKLEACIMFAERGGIARIGSLDDAAGVLAGRRGTTIH